VINAKSAIFSNTIQVTFGNDDGDVWFALDQHTELDFHSAISLKQQSVGKNAAPLGNSIPTQHQPVITLTP